MFKKNWNEVQHLHLQTNRQEFGDRGRENFKVCENRKTSFSVQQIHATKKECCVTIHCFLIVNTMLSLNDYCKSWLNSAWYELIEQYEV
jgi:hypothetical protein